MAGDYVPFVMNAFLIHGRMAFAALALAASLSITPATAQVRMSLDQAEARVQGRPLIPLPRIIAAVRSQQPFASMQYLGGPEFDAVRKVYRLKFLDGRRLVVVLVDARTGQYLVAR